MKMTKQEAQDKIEELQQYIKNYHNHPENYYVGQIYQRNTDNSVYMITVQNLRMICLSDLTNSSIEVNEFMKGYEKDFTYLGLFNDVYKLTKKSLS